MIKQRSDGPHHRTWRPLQDRNDNRASDSQPTETTPEGEPPANPFLGKRFDNPFEEMEFTNTLIASGHSETDIKEMSKEARLHEVFDRRLKFVQGNVDALKEAEDRLRLAYQFAQQNGQSAEEFESMLKSQSPPTFPV